MENIYGDLKKGNSVRNTVYRGGCLEEAQCIYNDMYEKYMGNVLVPLAGSKYYIKIKDVIKRQEQKTFMWHEYEYTIEILGTLVIPEEKKMEKIYTQLKEGSQITIEVYNETDIHEANLIYEEMKQYWNEKKPLPLEGTDFDIMLTDFVRYYSYPQSEYTAMYIVEVIGKLVVRGE